EIAPPEEEEVVHVPPEKEMEEITPTEEEEKEEIAPPEEEEVVHVPPEKEMEEITPTEEEEKEEIAPPEEEEVVHVPPEKEMEEITPTEEKKMGRPQIEALTENEKLIFEKYGNTGLKIYKLIDGKKTAEEIMLEVNVDEGYIIDFFSFLETRGIIRLERPKKEAGFIEEEEEEIEEKKEIKMEPISETIKKPKKEIIIRDMVPIDVPIPKKLSLPVRMSIEAKLLAKFGSKSLKVLNKINGESDIIKISIETGIDLNELDEILYSIANSGGCTFATLSEEDINRKYGPEAYKIYKVYGRDGIILYELIGKMDSIRKIVNFSKVDPKKAVEIILNINELLGIEGISKSDLYKELGIS
ncbi:MAG: hypothetical protein ACP5KJ_04140, partial [Candidatus Micrarchaeia archaeon]